VVVDDYSDTLPRCRVVPQGAVYSASPACRTKTPGGTTRHRGLIAVEVINNHKENQMTDQTNQPAAKLNYLGVEATIWGNRKKNGDGVRYSVTYSRHYKDSDDKWQSTHSLGELDNLKIGILYLRVADKISELKLNKQTSL
jgi:hypothetical protein